jgi:hypothetical protein
MENNNSNQDITAPTIESFNVDRMVAKPSNMVQFEVKVSDYQSGVVDVKLGDSVSFKVKATDVGSDVEGVSVTLMEGQYWNASEFGGDFEYIDLEYDSTENVWIGSIGTGWRGELCI